MLRSCWKRPKYIICFCVPAVMMILSRKELTSTQYGDRSLCIVDNFTVMIPSNAALANMTDNQLTDLYWSYINTIQVLCRKIIRIGTIEDGGKEVCTDVPFLPRPPCLVYSFGINYQWDFDEDVARIFGCEVFSFDPSMRNKSETYKYADNITFYKIGLGDKNVRTISILKIDIKGSEWTSIPQMVSSGTLRSVIQMQIELHGKGTKDALKVLQRNLICKYSRAGLVRARTSCMEVSMIRLSFPTPKCN
ncbi:hypothetical protein ACJMK2_006493 [Sinanodonta woodiana]|uniref:Methyltransferase domain-containing protein n=1 Tax=Sinanodonta woodiana TaxID=1069815 RepID=A0ABD3VUY8_SINWO